MTNHYVMPPEQPPQHKDNTEALVAIAGMLIAVGLICFVSLLATCNLSIPAWAAFGVGAFFGLSASISAALLYRFFP